MLLRFQPIYQQRVWGGRELQHLYGRPLPEDGQPYGESWELVDRPEAQSVVISPGKYHGLTLGELWTQHGDPVFGPNRPKTERFPLLCKILDARDVLSLQVHPPQAIAASLGGEPKTEMWVIADAVPGAQLYAGVTPGTTRESFAAAIQAQSLEPLVPSLPVQKGDFIFIPSGRLHAIGAGLVIFEIQQNSDTTYRVYDWGRVGLDGKPRDLHVEESLACIDFSDTTPALGRPSGDLLVDCDHFTVSRYNLSPGETKPWPAAGTGCSLCIVLAGSGSLDTESLSPGDHLLVSAEAPNPQLLATTELTVLHISHPTP